MVRRRTAGPPGPRGFPAVVGLDLAAVTSGKLDTTINAVLGGTATVNVTLKKAMVGAYVAFASLDSVSAGVLGGVVTVQEVRPVNSTTVTVVLKSTALLSQQAVTVVVGAILVS